MKRIFSLAMAFAVMLSVFVCTSTDVSAVGYNSSSAISFAEKNWNSGKGLCAEFVSDCLKAGGINIMEPGVRNLYNALNGKYGTSYVLKTDGPYIFFEDNIGKLSPGDPVFYYCNSCKTFQHAILCGTGDGDFMTDYAHNNPHHNETTYISWPCSDCGRINWTMYSIHIGSSNNGSGGGTANHTHSYTKKVMKKATCTSTGVDTYTCACGNSYTVETPKTNHTSAWVYTKRPTVFATGTKRQECSVCHKVLSSNTTVAKATGDVNGDKKVNSSDALIILRHTTGYQNIVKNEVDFLNADVNGDGYINSSDALVILQIATGGKNI